MNYCEPDVTYPLDKYRYYKHELADGSIEIFAVSSYAGKTVKGKARCHAKDIENFDEEKGKQLAALRCDLKIAEKRMARAAKCYKYAVENQDRAAKLVADMDEYAVNSVLRKVKSEKVLKDFIENNF